MNTTTPSRKSKDYTGQKFGRLFVLKDLGFYRSPAGQSKRIALCRCDCGKEVNVILSNVTRGHTNSCGCLRREKITFHGMHKSRTYSTWKHMKSRCFDKKNDNYELYGGRGITICDRWAKYENFFEDMGERPKGKTIDRKDNDCDYCKANCRWATQREQSNNTRRNRFLEHNGERLTISQWARKLNINKTTLRLRLERSWSIEKTLTTPIHGNS